jgi:sn-glycerol 3-phosphate transport system permease protein
LEILLPTTITDNGFYFTSFYFIRHLSDTRWLVFLDMTRVDLGEESPTFSTKNSKSRRERSEWLAGFVLLLPAIVLLCSFIVWPVISGAILSFQQEDPFGKSRAWAGFANYLELASRPEFWASVVTTLKFTGVVAPLELLLGLCAALLVWRPFAGSNFYRTLFFLTTAVPTSVAAVAWSWFLNPLSGWANWILAQFGMSAQPWLTDPAFAIWTLGVITAWAGVGFVAILLTAGLQGIPEDLYEAARLDGASSWTQFWKITLPLLSPTLFLVGLLIMFRSLTAFGQIHLLTRGGPAESSFVWIYRVYQDAFFNFRYTYAAAEGITLFLGLLLLAALQFRFLGRKVHYE